MASSVLAGMLGNEPYDFFFLGFLLFESYSGVQSSVVAQMVCLMATTPRLALHGDRCHGSIVGAPQLFSKTSYSSLNPQCGHRKIKHSIVPNAYVAQRPEATHFPEEQVR
jgi:hypothetical protein